MKKRPAWIASLITWPIVLLIAFPLLWMLITSVKPAAELFSTSPTLLPNSITFEHYARVLQDTPFLQYFANSMILATSTTVVVISISVLGAYSLVRFAYPGRETLASLVLLTYLLPSVVLISPLYLMLVSIGLANTLASLVIAYTTFALPYALWLLRSFMAGIPQDLESAAMVDGASRMGAFVDVVLPQALQATRQAILNGMPVAAALAAGQRTVKSAGFRRLDYLELVDGETLHSLGTSAPGARLMVAGVIGTMWLIDNIALH